MRARRSGTCPCCRWTSPRALRRPGACTAIRIRFKRAAEARFEDWRVVRVPIASDGAMHRYTVGSTVPLALDGAGTLRLEPECDAGRR
jgi:hypothetical protein